MGFKRIVAAAIALALLVGGLSVFLIFIQVGTLGSAKFWVDHTRLVIGTNQQLLRDALELENGERGYLITGDAAYVGKNYQAAKDAIPSLEKQLRDLVKDKRVQEDRAVALTTAIDKRAAFIAQVVAATRANGVASGQAMVRTGNGRLVMQDIRDRAQEIDTEENRLLVQRVNGARGFQSLMLAAGLGVAFLALLALTAGVILLARSNRSLNAALAETSSAEAARDALTALTNALFANVPDYLIVLNVEAGDRFVVADINPAMAQALNINPEQVRGRAINDMMPGPGGQRLLAHFGRVRAAGKPATTRDEIPFPTGQRVWESVYAPVLASDGAGERMIGSIRDITDRVRAEERLRDAQRMEAVGQLTGGVAHDFNNLLQVIRGNLELLQPLTEGNERAAQRLKNALFGAERAAQLTRQLLAFARRQPLEPKVVNLSRLVNDMAELLRRTLGEAIEVETVVAGGLWNTLVDPAQVESALLNLALNARDAMPGGGRLTVEITNTALDESYARAASDVTPGQYVMLAVTDTGEGMSDEVRARVFEPFYTTKKDGRGTGLGLSMVYGFVKQSSGHIQIYSELGHGTTVKIYLPRSRQPEQAARPEPAITPTPQTARTILVVEDDDAVREATLGILDELGYGALEAADADAALKLVESGAVIDLVFTDVVMPGSTPTRAFAQKVNDLRPHLPILFTSGYTDNAIIHQGRLDDGVHLISKPYAKADLAARLAQLLAAAQAAPGP